MWHGFFSTEAGLTVFSGWDKECMVLIIDVAVFLCPAAGKVMIWSPMMDSSPPVPVQVPDFSITERMSLDSESSGELEMVDFLAAMIYAVTCIIIDVGARFSGRDCTRRERNTMYRYDHHDPGWTTGTRGEGYGVCIC